MENAADADKLSQFEPAEIEALLKGVLADIAKAAGVATAIRVAGNLGGFNLAIHPDGRPDEKLVKLLGTTIATAIANTFVRNVLVYLCIPLMPVNASLFKRFADEFRTEVLEAEEILTLGLSEKTLLQNLPPMLAKLAREIGLPSTLAFEREFGGQQMYLSSSPLPDSRIVQAVGMEAALKIADVLGGDQHFIVPGSFRRNSLRRLKGLRMFECGASTNSVSKTLGVNRSTVMDWKSRYLDPSDIGGMKIEAPSKPAESTEGDVAGDGAFFS